MSEFRIGDAPIISGSIELPRVGRWHAALMLDTDQAPSGDVEIKITSGDQTVTLTGTARRTGVYQARTEILVVGGKDKLGTVIAAKYYTDTTVRHVVQDALNDAGETLSDTSTSSILDGQIAKWTRRNAPAQQCLEAIARTTGAVWRVLTDGKVWFGTESWNDAGLDEYDLMRDQPSEGHAEIAAPIYPATLLPGTTFRGGHVGKVRHMISASRLRTGVWTEDAQRNDDVGYVRAAISQATAPFLWQGIFAGKITQQDDDLTLQVTPDDPALPGLTKVPIRTFLPGVKAKVKKDARVTLAFENGDPAKPVALLFEADASKLDELVIETADGAKVTLKSGGSVDVSTGGDEDLTWNGGSAKVGRVDDSVEVTIPAGSFVTTVTGSAAGVLNLLDVKVQGTIKAGADAVKA